MLTDNQIFGLSTQKLQINEYATANDKDRLFVSKYKLKLPSEEELKAFLENELRKGWDL